MNPLYFLVAERAQHRCECCHAPESIFNVVMEVEHIIPVAKGGGSSDNNLALACRSCNGFKGIRSSYIDSESGQEQRFYHPRQDQWSAIDTHPKSAHIILLLISSDLLTSEYCRDIELKLALQQNTPISQDF
jgi:hypothetical protein